jgi:hypothetical protein
MGTRSNMQLLLLLHEWWPTKPVIQAAAHKQHTIDGQS